MSSSAHSDFSPFSYETIRPATHPLTIAATLVMPLNDADEEAQRRQRAPAHPRERVLTQATLVWMESLPPDRQPHTLCHTYPRVANRIALCWGDHTLSGMLFADLLSNRRRGRRGFPAAVNAELFALRDLAGHGPKAVAPEKRRII